MLEGAHAVPALLVVIVVIALFFDFINGFHDSANAIATVVSTRVITPRVAVVMSAAMNFIGAFLSTKVAQFVAKGLIYPDAVTQPAILAAVLGAIVWNLITWRYGIPSSSTHALLGGLCGAAIMAGGLHHTVIWMGLVGKVIVPLVFSPLVGFGLGYGIMVAIYALFARLPSGRAAGVFRPLQVLTAAMVSLAHGMNDAQKTMGIITLALVAFHVLPKAAIPPHWVIAACAIAMGLGTAAGGWRIIRTMGQKIIRLEPAQGFAAQAAASITILAATLKSGMPVSTTHVVSGSIFGVGASKRMSAVRWGVAQSMVVAWVLTLPAAGLVAALVELAFRAMHLH